MIRTQFTTKLIMHVYSTHFARPVHKPIDCVHCIGLDPIRGAHSTPIEARTSDVLKTGGDENRAYFHASRGKKD